MVDVLRWGVLGTAGIARGQLIPAIQRSANGRVMAIASRDRSRAAELGIQFGIPTVHDIYSSLISDPLIDAIYIPLPNALHAEWAIQAAEAGKAVLCEKPLAISAAQARNVVDVFAARGVPLMEGFMYRFHPQNVRALELVANDRIGAVREVHAHLSVDIMADFDPGNVRFSNRLGGGSLLDMGCYAVDIVRRVFGAAPATVIGWLDVDERLGVDVSAGALLGYDDGRLGVISSSFRAGGQGTYRIIGVDGTIEAPRAFIPGLGSRVAEGLIVVVDTDGRRDEQIFEPTDHYQLMIEAFAASVLSRKPAPFAAEDAVNNLRILDAIIASARSGNRISLN
jgi:D-xylose 1-dehydrogenase (NADP+, D-xylono-1,5-lactone-forming)